MSANQCSNKEMDIYEMRISRLRKLIADDFADNQAAFARVTAIKPSQVNRWLSKNAKKIPEMSEQSARYIEEKCRKPSGWMDSDNPIPLLSAQSIKLAEIISSLPDVQQAAMIHLVESTLEMQRQAHAVGQTALPGDHLDK